MTSLAYYLNLVLYGSSPFDGFDASCIPLDLQGWFTNAEAFDRIIARLKPNLIIEVGTWKGKSAIHALKRAMEFCDCSIVCVDTWLGSLEHWTKHSAAELLRRENGLPMVYRQFLANIVHCGLQNRVVPIPLPSRIAAQVIADVNAKADLVYIDGSHDEQSVSEDISSYWPLLRDGGYMIGDDYNMPSVRAAVTNALSIPSSMQWRGAYAGSCWMIEKLSAQIEAA